LLVQTEHDVKALNLAADTRVAYITQTTLSVDDTRAIIAALKRRFTDIVGPDINDICYATQNRQSAVRELAKLADVILVVGAKNSSNSNRLREIGVEAGVPSYLVADGSELMRMGPDAALVGSLRAPAPEVGRRRCRGAVWADRGIDASGIEEKVDPASCRTASSRRAPCPRLIDLYSPHRDRGHPY
jgi:hypothetical protein